MTAAGLIFANLHDQSIPELTRVRSMASVPFGCRYRLIDFTLSDFTAFVYFLFIKYKFANDV